MEAFGVLTVLMVTFEFSTHCWIGLSRIGIDRRTMLGLLFLSTNRRIYTRIEYIPHLSEDLCAHLDDFSNSKH
ncbi:hypothetical protein HAX54_043372, partial [Datura stramonium]|nr:hypothetical protein [Datura stramonium]